MIDQALAAAPFTAKHIDPLYLDERADLAVAALAARPLPSYLVDDLVEALSEADRTRVIDVRCILAMTEPGRLEEFDYRLEDAAAIEKLPELAAHLAPDGALSEHLVSTVVMRLGEWLEQQPEHRAWTAQVEEDRQHPERWTPIAHVPRDAAAGWLSGAHGAAVMTPPRPQTPPVVRPRARAPRPQRRALTRSSSRSGDSGDPHLDDPDPEPPGEAVGLLFVVDARWYRLSRSLANFLRGRGLR